MHKHENDIQFQNFCHNVKWLRKKYKYSRSKMAKILGIGIKTLDKLENGELAKSIGVTTIGNIYRHFNIHPVEQFGKRFDK